MAKNTNWALSSIETLPVVPDSLASGSSNPLLNQGLWSENFQDISDYCNIGTKMANNSLQQLGEQLNTPVIDICFPVPEDEFDFGGLRSSGDRFNLYEETDPWGAQNDNSNTFTNKTSHTEIWTNTELWLNNPPNINEQDDIIDNIDIDSVDDTNLNLVLEEKPLRQDSLLNSNRDVLLSQSNTYKQPTFFVEEEQSRQKLLNDNLIVNDEQLCDQINVQLQRQNVLSYKNVNNNSSNATNMNIVGKNNIYDNVNVNIPFKQELRSFDQSKIRFDQRGSPVSNTKRDLVNIFKTDEPFIRETHKQVSSCTINENFISSSIKITDSVRTTCGKTGSKGSSFDEYIVPDLVKSEPVDNIAMEVEVIDEPLPCDTVVLRKCNKKELKLPLQNLKKTALKLDIDSASKLGSSVFTPTTIAANCDVVSSTPEVLKPLLSSSTGFDLVNFINSQDGSSDDLTTSGVSSGRTNNSSISSNEIKKNVAIIKPVQHPNISIAGTNIKVQPCYPSVLPSLPVVKEEPEDSETTIKKEEYPSTIADNLLSPKPKTLSTRRVKRKRIVKKSEDMESDLSNLSDFMEEDDEERDHTFTLHSKPNRRKRTSSSTSRTSTDYGGGCSSHYSEQSSCSSKQRRLSRDSDSSDHESIVSNMDRYRELRDRNNEASRRSRLNRKSREYEMKQHAVQLQNDNKRLKVKADELEKLVHKFRESLMKLVKNKR